MVFLYLAKLTSMKSVAVLPAARQENIDFCNNQRLRSQKRGVWLLLQRGSEHALGPDIRNATFELGEDGKWRSPDFCFSLSHSGKYVCVALGDEEVGVDVEELPNEKFNEKLYEKIACEGEVCSGEREIAALYTKKEALFKREGGKVFRPEKINTCNTDCRSYFLEDAVISVTDKAPAAFYIDSHGTVRKLRQIVQL